MFKYGLFEDWVVKWWEGVGVVLSVGFLIKLFIWVLDLVVADSLGGLLKFFLSSIFALLLILIFILNQVQKELEKIKEFLKKKGFKNEEGLVEMMKKVLGKKKGSVDSRLLWIPVALIILYMLYKAGIFG